MRWGRCATRVAAVGGLALLAIVPASTAGAQEDAGDGCTASMGGIDVRSASTPDNAIEVDADDELTLEASSTAPLTRYEIELEFAGFRWPVADGDVSGTSWSDTVAVDDYATYATGIYKVHGVSFDGSGEVCHATAYVDVSGTFPLATVAGAAALVAFLAGLALLLTGGRPR